ncbi:MAG: hypothetical protein ACRDT6_27185 [Micromonosporaceae bacterium]
MGTYDELVAEATGAPLSGWELGERLVDAGTPWSYQGRASELIAAATGPVLELGTGDTAQDAAVVLSWHEPYRPEEVARVLGPGGVFLTEQAGGLDGLSINESLEAPFDESASDWSLGTARAALESAGLQIAQSRTAFPERVFHDVGALIYFLRITPRQVPDFSVERYDKQLRILHDQMSAGEPFRDRAVRFLIEAVRS